MEYLRKEFIAESREGLDRMEECLTKLEQRHTDPELVDELFRIIHTLKGTTGFLGFTRLEALAHAGEHLFGALRGGHLDVTAQLVTLLLNLLDRIRKIVLLIEKTGAEGSRSDDRDDFLIETFRRLSQRALKASQDERARAGQSSAQSAPSDKDIFDPLSASSDRSEKTIRIDVDVLNRMMNLVSELVLTRNQILQSRPNARDFVSLGRRLDTVTSDLRETVMQARMQPLGNLFHIYPRMVRDLAKACERTVRIEFSGQEVCLDKSLLEAIKDPITHAVRNAVDHGIEPPGTRIRIGKPVVGVIRLRASQQAGSVLIEISDDGAGIPLDKVRDRAVDQKLLTPEQANAMTDRDILQMAFRPGFSTAESVTHVSGRGVGMDVVRSNVEKIGGSVELESHAGKGTILRLRVPLTLAIIPALVVLSAGQTFAIPQGSLVELVYISHAEACGTIQIIDGTGRFRIREHLAPIVRLDHLLDLEARASTQTEAFYLALLDVDGRRFALMLDDLVAPEEIVVKPLSPVLRELGVFSGAAILGDATLTLILDPHAIAARAGIDVSEPETAAPDPFHGVLLWSPPALIEANPVEVA
ncbi:chemotaxis protein CheA [Granulicella sibirica]|uniref:histidine kinase n=1 Tax=Granulicella sibirica TaxID=2479048 RepID=A0A4Q0SX45_9BACT|nr:chemotaxis protein CheA [Granulicella sibirica]RXH54992.1 Signal transduction histidine kinase CheA [Granulicella sibirica]